MPDRTPHVQESASEAVLSAESAFDPGLLRRVASDCEAGGLGGAARLLRDIAWHVEHFHARHNTSGASGLYPTQAKPAVTGGSGHEAGSRSPGFAPTKDVGLES